MLYELIKAARLKGASDLHLHKDRTPMIRILGNLQPLTEKRLSEIELEGFCTELLDNRQLQLWSKARQIDIAFTDTLEGRCRANIYQANNSPSLAIRLIDKKIPTCQQLGIPKQAELLAELKQGLVLVTGPTGCGKSTTLAALIEKLNQEKSLHIVTLEDPIEFIYNQGNSVIDQREVGVDTDSFSSGLRSCLRQDPDVILVGELRDKETMEIALIAAETGHLVLSTLHTLGATATVNRIVDVFQDKEQIRSQLSVCLKGIISQQLIPTRDGKSRVAAFEILIANEGILNLIREGKTHQLKSYLETGSRQGMITMEKSLQLLQQQGLI